MDDLKFVMTWHDAVDPFCQLSCEVRTERVSAESVPFYVMDSRVRALSILLSQFARHGVREFSWSNAPARREGERADFTLSFSRRDLSGRIRCEVILRVDDEPGHGCAFYADALEDAQLDKLARQLDAMDLC